MKLVSVRREAHRGHATKREYERNPRKFDRWVKADTVFGLILAMGMLAMAVAGLNSGGPSTATEFSSVTVPK
jgi:hypothetical protein